MSMLEDWVRIKAVLEQALTREGAERASYVAAACGSDPVLRQRIEALLASHEASASFLETPAVSQLDLQPSEDLTGEIVGTYRLLARAGAGAMGEVYLAHDGKLDRRVAVKFMAQHHARDEDRLRRFRQEARAASSLNHPNILVVHDFGDHRGRPFIVTEFVDGETLRDRLNRGPLPIREAVQIASQIAGALAAAHAGNLIHRDIKPENVMVRRDGYIKVLDFGLAKLARTETPGDRGAFDTHPGQAAGTPRYMAPEQARGLGVDPSTDTWSLGAVLYEMIAGRPPFDGNTAADVLAAVLTTEPVPLSSYVNDAPRALVGVVARALRKNRADRYAHGAEFVTDLAAIQRQLETGSSDRPPRSADRADSDGVGLPAAGERRRATVLVSIVSDYASLIERLAPDDLDRALDGIRATAAETVRRHGGIVNQSIGEEVVALFGVPTAHEDDDVSAVRAALELRVQAHETSGGISLRVQSGVHAGSVVAKSVREGPNKYSVTGSPIEIARRLATAAEADAVLISPDLQRAVGAFVRTEPRPAVSVDARGQMMTPHAVTTETGIDSRLAVADRLTPFIGRTTELAALTAELEHAVAGEGRLVLVVGEAGTGKSRLLHELRSRVMPSRASVLQARCRSHGGTASYLPFVQAVREVLDVVDCEPGEPPVADLVNRIHGVDPSLEPFVPLYLHLLSRESEAFPLPRHLRGEHFSAAMHDALAAMLTSYAHRRPALLLLEDWHWADDASRDAVRQLAAVVASYPLLIVVTARPESGVVEALPEAKTRIVLNALNAAASREIITAVLGTAGVPDELARRLHDRTGGNPFFLEEMCHALREAGFVAAVADGVVVDWAANLNLPDSVQGVIRSRIDRLNPEAREVVRIASVVGREFTRGILADVVPGVDLSAALERLKDAGLLQQTRIVPDAVYRFKHVLTQEVAYDSLLEHQRKTLHLSVGKAMEDRHARGPDAPLELLAYHFSRAEAWPEAIEYGERAADRATALSEFADALALLERVHSWLLRVDLTNEVRDRIANVLLKQERACETLGLRSRQQELCADLIALLAPHGASARLAEAYLRQGDVLTLLKRFNLADRALATALRISREHADAALERSALRSIGLLRWHEGRHEEALAITESALAIDRERGDDAAVAGDLVNLVPILRNMGQHERALAYLDEALALCVLGDDTIKRLFILQNAANIHRALGDTARALKILEEADDLARTHMLPIERSFHLTAIAHIQLQQARLPESIRYYQEAVQLSRRARHADGLAQSLRMLGELLFTLGRDEEALPHLQEAAQLFGQLEDLEGEAAMLHHVAAVRERAEHPEARNAWQRARDAARAANDLRAELDAVEGVARSIRRLDPSDAIPTFADAVELASRLGDQRRQATLRNTLGILEWERGGYTEALRHYEAALALARQLGDPAQEGLTLNSIGVTLARLHRYDEGRTALEDALTINRGSGQRLLESHTLAALGDISLALGRSEAALQAFEAALAIRRDLGNRPAEGWMLQRIAATRARTGDLNGAGEYFSAAARIAAECGDDRLRRACTAALSAPSGS